MYLSLSGKSIVGFLFNRKSIEKNAESKHIQCHRVLLLLRGIHLQLPKCLHCVISNKIQSEKKETHTKWFVSGEIGWVVPLHITSHAPNITCECSNVNGSRCCCVLHCVYQTKIENQTQFAGKKCNRLSANRYANRNGILCNNLGRWAPFIESMANFLTCS